jgi:predicted 3-demethylubiquinone-9 3-methyltransferase (glyoxalase superfamily)
MTRIKIPYSKNTDTVRAMDACIWCKDKFGNSFYPVQINDNRWAYIGLGEFSFNQEEDAMLFALRWL